MAIKLEEHKVYVESHKMEMVPYSIAIQALDEKISEELDTYTKEIEKTMEELRKSISDIKIG